MTGNDLFSLEIQVSNHDETDKLPSERHISNSYIYGLMLSIVVHVVDIIMDINLAYQYYRYNEAAYFMLTTAFIIIPSVIVNCASARMYTLMEMKVSVKKNIIRTLSIAFQLGPVLRCYELIVYAIKCKKADKLNNSDQRDEYYLLVTKEDANIALLRILESFLESAPQQILQIAILLSIKYNQYEQWLQAYQLIAILTSVISMTWSIVLYNRSIRFADENVQNIHWSASIVLFIWHILTIGARILSTSEVASVFPKGTLIFCISHCLLTGLWLRMLEPSQFCTVDGHTVSSRLMETLFCFSLGFVYYFVYVPTIDGKRKKKYLLYYTTYYLEILMMATLWYAHRQSVPSLLTCWWYTTVYATTLLIFPLGILFMLFYYCYWHPKFNKESFIFCIKTKTLDNENDDDNVSAGRKINTNSIGTQTDQLLQSFTLKSVSFRYAMKPAVLSCT